MGRHEAIEENERDKAIIDAFDYEPRGPGRVAERCRLTRSTVTGLCHRYGFARGQDLIVDLARAFPDATAEEIAEACGRDMAPEVLKYVGIDRKSAGYRKYRVKAMRETLAALVS
jgi:hypothetical protein